MNRLSLLLVAILILTIIIFAFKNKTKQDPSIRMQTGIVVSDLEKSFEFYTKVVGMTKVGTFHVDPDMATDAGLTDHKAIDIIDLKLTDEPGKPEYKITKIQEVKGSVINSFQPGNRYITIFVNDLKPYIKRLKEHNISLWNSKRLNFGEGGVLIFNDPDGGMIEIQGPSVK